jgi:hypothetical protein
MPFSKRPDEPALPARPLAYAISAGCGVMRKRRWHIFERPPRASMRGCTAAPGNLSRNYDGVRAPGSADRPWTDIDAASSMRRTRRTRGPVDPIPVPRFVEMPASIPHGRLTWLTDTIAFDNLESADGTRVGSGVAQWLSHYSNVHGNHDLTANCHSNSFTSCKSIELLFGTILSSIVNFTNKILIGSPLLHIP